MCQYLSWADLHNVFLTISFDQTDLDTCKNLDKVLINYAQFVDSKLNHLSSTQFMQYLHDHIQSVSGSIDYKNSLHYKKYQLRNDLSRRPEMISASNAAA